VGKSISNTTCLRSTQEGEIEEIEKDDNGTGSSRRKIIARSHFER
jgi:hypothetical protein